LGSDESESIMTGQEGPVFLWKKGMNDKSYKGLTTHEVNAQRAVHGLNVIEQKAKTSALSVLLRQVKNNFIFYLLVFAALISFTVGKAVTGYVITFVILLVVGVGFYLEYKAEKAIEALKKLIDDTCEVLRDGKKQLVSVTELVPGDIIFLKNGDKIPADSIVLASNDLTVNESALTGESVEVEKRTAIDDKTPVDEQKVFMGTYVVNGTCVCRVEHIGMATQFGKIAGMIVQTEKGIPLQEKINSVSKYMIAVSLVFSLLTGLLLVLRAPAFETEVLIGILTVVIALSVSAVPEGLPVVLVTTLATGAMRMAKKNAVVNRMGVIGTIGETTVICTDKTGTITTGEMTVKKVVTGDGSYSVGGSGYGIIGKVIFDKTTKEAKEKDLSQLLHAAIICNDSSVNATNTKKPEVIGTPTEIALLVLGLKLGVAKNDVKISRKKEKPFNSARKMMSVLADDGNIYAKGALEVLLPKCTEVLINGKIVPMTNILKDQILKENKALNGQAYRTLTLVMKKHAGKGEYKEDDFAFLGLVGIEDPPREEVKDAIAVCKEASIDVKMITGDSKETAVAIGKQIGLTGEVLEGKQLDSYTDHELRKVVKDVSIFARVRPEHKVRIVKALKANKELVAMTGDGVNDAPALKESHVGIAMGQNGTDVSRSVADITLKDDNFATIVEAIKEGRSIFQNIQTFVGYQLSCNLAQLTILFIGVLLGPFLGWEIPLLVALQILLVNLVTDNIPAITLGLIPASEDIMKRKPNRNALLTKSLITYVVSVGILTGAVTLGVYYLVYDIFGATHEEARSVAFVSFIIAAIVNALSFRSLHTSIFHVFTKDNILLFGAAAVSLIATLLVVYMPINSVFETTPLILRDWYVVFAAVAAVTVGFETIKRFVKVQDNAFATVKGGERHEMSK
jgi:P-type Ca2+ transporter type 2C